jgi:beta-galactosidase
MGHEDEILRVSVYTRGSTVRLELNGRVIGEKRFLQATNPPATFDVPYEPGELKAVALDQGRNLP